MPNIDVLLMGHLPARPEGNLRQLFAVHDLPGHGPLPTAHTATVRAIVRGGHGDIGMALFDAFPKVEIVANMGVGYDGIDCAEAAKRGILVTNTPDVLTEEVADTTLGLILMTVRELSAAERHLRAGQWPNGGYPLTPATMRDRTAGIVGLGRIGKAIARRLEAMQVPVVYHNRNKAADAPWPYYADLKEMAKAVDILVSVLPGTPATKNLIDVHVLRALGPDGIFINIGRGSVADEPALIQALSDGTIRAAGLDVFADEPNVPAELIAMDNVVLLPHVGSASIYTRDAMGQLAVDNLTNWFEKGAPLTPVAETPWPRK